MDLILAVFLGTYVVLRAVYSIQITRGVPWMYFIAYVLYSFLLLTYWNALQCLSSFWWYLFCMLNCFEFYYQLRECNCFFDIL